MLPSMGRKVPEAYDDSIREIIFYNYQIIYMIEGTESILVLAVIHAARDLNNINPSPCEFI
jgi:plasmid stabilization system protein ParE